MICLSLELKNKNYDPLKIIDCYIDEEKATALFSEIRDIFSDFLLKPAEENGPFLCMKLVGVEKNGKKSVICLKPAESFRIEIKERMVHFIEETLKSKAS